MNPRPPIPTRPYPLFPSTPLVQSASSLRGPPVFLSISMAAQYSFVMKDLSKTYPGAQKPTLNNLSLQFYPDAKIGIVGPNGTGKSTLIDRKSTRLNSSH